MKERLGEKGGAFLNAKEGRVGFRKKYYDVTIKDIAFAYLEGYIHAKVTGHLLQGKVLSSDLDKVKKIAVECMKDYISQLNLSEKEKEELKQNREHWADLALKGVKQRLYESGKIR